jgi:hypothetical protein
MKGQTMETMVYIKRDGQNPVPVRLKTVRHNGQWLALAEIQTRTGPVRLTAMASEQTVADLIKRGAARLPLEMAASGADAFASIAKLAQSQAAQNVLKQAQNVVKHPLFMNALSFIPGFGPAMAKVNQATNAVKAAENLMGRARQGDRKAQSSVNVIASSAKKGSKKGTVLLALLQAADGIRKTFFSGEPTEVNDVTQFGAWSPPWTTTPTSGNSWTPPWGGNAPQAQPQQQLPPQPQQQLPPPQLPPAQPPQGWPQIPPKGQPPANPWPPPMAQMPYGWPQPPPYPWPWFPSGVTPKC